MAPTLLEREDQLARLGSALAAAQEGEGRLVVVEGPAGMGKTALLLALRAQAEAAGMRVLRARGAELEQEFGYGIVRQLLEPPLVAAGPDERADLLAGAAGLAAERLGFAGAMPADPTEGRPDAAFAVLHGLYWLCANLAARRPLVLAVDDAHWADAPSLRFLVFLLTRLEELPVALVVATRPEYHGPAREVLPALVAEPAATLLQPPPLSAEAIAALAAAALADTPDPAFVAACLRATRGTPFLVRQLLVALHEDGVRPVAASAPLVERHGVRTVARWILVRLDRLTPAAGSLARAVAVLERAELPGAAALAGLEPPAAAAAADELETAGILEPGRPLSFAHPIVRAAVYGELSGAERALGHRRAAELLDGDGDPAAAERAAEHLLATAPAGDPWVADRLAAAGRAAVASGAPDSAVTYLRRALAEPPAADARGARLLELGLAEVSAGLPDAEAHLRAALDLLPRGREQLTAALSLAQVLTRAQRSPDAVPVFERAIAALGSDDPALARLLEVGTVSMAMIHEGSAPAVAARLDELRARAAEPGPAQRERLAAAAIWACVRNEPAAVAAALAERAVRLSARPVPAPTDLPWFLQAQVTLLWTDRFAAARRGLDAGLVEARSTGDGVLLPACYSHRCLLFLRTGDFAAAEDDARAALEITGSPPELYRLMATTGLAESLLEQADLEGAEAAIAAVGAAVEGGTIQAAMVRHVRGRVALAALRPDDALGDFLAAGAVLEGCLAVTPAIFPWRSEAALAQLALGRRAAAERLAGEELELARAFGAPRALGIALRGAGALTGGPPGEALLYEALDVLAGADVPIALAKTQVELGARLRRENRRAEARRLLKTGLDTAHRLGAQLLAERAETELRATGAKPRRAVLTGLDALTASELRVAELAAQGLTNREIAQALYVTSRTVEGHLTQVFRKLEVPSREALGGLLEVGAVG